MSTDSPPNPTWQDFLLARIAETRQWGETFSSDALARAWVLADCDAKAALVIELAATFAVARAADEVALEGVMETCVRTLQWLTWPYVEHPDCQGSWRAAPDTASR